MTTQQEKVRSQGEVGLWMARSVSGVPLHRQGRPKIVSNRFAETILGTHP